MWCAGHGLWSSYVTAKGIKEMGVKVATHIDECLYEQDFINILRIQYERKTCPISPQFRNIDLVIV